MASKPPQAKTQKTEQMMENSGERNRGPADRAADPEFMRRYNEDMFAYAKKLSDFVGFMVRTTFLSAASLYFTVNIADQTSSFWMVTYAVCALGSLALGGAMLSNVVLTALGYGFVRIPWNRSLLIQSIGVSLVFSLTFFMVIGCYVLGSALASSSILTGAN